MVASPDKPKSRANASNNSVFHERTVHWTFLAQMDGTGLRRRQMETGALTRLAPAGAVF